ncbi:MAG TPA: hypothetical protein VGC92_04275, partial [Phenylobacterium sp.]
SAMGLQQTVSQFQQQLDHLPPSDIHSVFDAAATAVSLSWTAGSGTAWRAQLRLLDGAILTGDASSPGKVITDARCATGATVAVRVGTITGAVPPAPDVVWSAWIDLALAAPAAPVPKSMVLDGQEVIAVWRGDQAVALYEATLERIGAGGGSGGAPVAASSIAAMGNDDWQARFGGPFAAGDVVLLRLRARTTIAAGQWSPVAAGEDDPSRLRIRPIAAAAAPRLTNRDASIDAAWDAVADAETYQLQVSGQGDAALPSAPSIQLVPPLAARIDAAPLEVGRTYEVRVRAARSRSNGPWGPAASIVWAPKHVRPATVGDWAGSYATDTHWWGGFFDPLVVTHAGKVSLAGVPLAATFDPALQRLTWDWTPIKNTVAKGDIRFAGPPGTASFSGSINPRQIDGPVEFRSVGYTPPPAPFGAKVNFVAQTVQADNARFEALQGMVYNSANGGWMLKGLGSTFRVVFTLHSMPESGLKLSLYHCTASRWPADGYAPVNININATALRVNFDPAQAHHGTGVDTRDYVSDTFDIPAAVLTVGDNT